MQKSLRLFFVVSVALVSTVALVPSAAAKPVDETGALPRIQFLDPSRAVVTPGPTSGAGIFAAALTGTTFYGGTVWAADSMRWEARQGELWTFDTGMGSSVVPPVGSTYPGVNPYKASGLHQTLEGWIGIDNTYSEVTYFRRLSTAQSACVGAPAGLGGTYSFYAGVLPGEAGGLCSAEGGGYGNSWNVCIGKTFAWTAGPAALWFLYRCDTEPGFDFGRVVCDTSGGAGEDAQVGSFDGSVSGRAYLVLRPGYELPVAGPRPVVLKFCVTTDGAYSDEDGLYPTSCGAFAVDDIAMVGSLSEKATFETGNDGWELVASERGDGGDWSNLVNLADLPSPQTPCACVLEDTVLVFEDVTVGGHGVYQDNMAASPWIDLGPDGWNDPRPGKVIRADVYADLPVLNYVFAKVAVQWYPEACSKTGKLTVSGWRSDGLVYTFGGTPRCTTPQEPLGIQLDLSALMPPTAEQIRIAVGVISYCRFFGQCTGATNSSPWFDNVGLGVYGDPSRPFICAREIDLPQDAFPENGGLSGSAPGRFDCNTVKGAKSPEIGTSLGDTLVVLGGTGGAEVWVEFAVDPGPGLNPNLFNAWRSSHFNRGSHRGQTWYAARLDTAEQGEGGPVPGRWMTTYHESDPNFSGTDRTPDPTDLDPNGGTTRLANDIFPDNLLTPGTHIFLFYRTKFVTAPDVLASWSVFPDTTGGNYVEWECLPSSEAPTGDGGWYWNCLLYVDHDEGSGAQARIEAALSSVFGGTSGSFERTNWDRWDVRAPSSHQCSFGRPLQAEYGANLVQALAYVDVIWNSGEQNAFVLTKEDSDVLFPWLTLTGTGVGNNDLYLSGDGIVTSPIVEGASEPSARRIIQDVAGVDLRCRTYRDPNCPIPGTGEDLTPCIDLVPVRRCQ